MVVVVSWLGFTDSRSGHLVIINETRTSECYQEKANVRTSVHGPNINSKHVILKDNSLQYEEMNISTTAPQLYLQVPHNPFKYPLYLLDVKNKTKENCLTKLIWVSCCCSLREMENMSERNLKKPSITRPAALRASFGSTFSGICCSPCFSVFLMWTPSYSFEMSELQTSTHQLGVTHRGTNYPAHTRCSEWWVKVCVLCVCAYVCVSMSVQVKSLQTLCLQLLPVKETETFKLTRENV